MADPMTAIAGSMTGAERVAIHNENARRRLTPDVRVVGDASGTQGANDELVRIAATAAPRTWALLPAATANAHYLDVTDADGTNTLTIEPDGSEQIDGASNLVLTAAARLLLIPDGTAWSVWDLTP